MKKILTKQRISKKDYPNRKVVVNTNPMRTATSKILNTAVLFIF